MRTLFPNFFKILEDTIGISNYVYKNGILMVEVPGFTKNDIKITIEDGIMRIQGKKEILGETYHINKGFILPEGTLNSDDPITAKIEDGLLFINLKQSQRSKQKIIDIS